LGLERDLSSSKKARRTGGGKVQKQTKEEKLKKNRKKRSQRGPGGTEEVNILLGALAARGRYANRPDQVSRLTEKRNSAKSKKFTSLTAVRKALFKRLERDSKGRRREEEKKKNTTLRHPSYSPNTRGNQPIRFRGVIREKTQGRRGIGRDVKKCHILGGGDTEEKI